MKAFPHGWINEHGNQCQNFGMDLRDYFAAKAMQGYIAGLSSDAEMLNVMVRVAKAKGVTSDAYVAMKAYEQADAMMKERGL